MWFISNNNSCIDEAHYNKKGLAALLEEADKWLPFSKYDNNNLDHESADSVVVGEDRLYHVDKSTMQMNPIYWEGPRNKSGTLIGSLSLQTRNCTLQFHCQ